VPHLGAQPARMPSDHSGGIQFDAYFTRPTS